MGNQKWERVGKKRKKKKRPPRKDVLRITNKGEMAYVEILRKVKNEPELKDVGQHVKLIRKLKQF